MLIAQHAQKPARYHSHKAGDWQQMLLAPMCRSALTLCLGWSTVHCRALPWLKYSKAVMDLCKALLPLVAHLQPCQSLADRLGLSPGMCLC